MRGKCVGSRYIEVAASRQGRCPTVESWGGENEIMKQSKKGAASGDLGIESGVLRPARMIAQPVTLAQPNGVRRPGMACLFHPSVRQPEVPGARLVVGSGGYFPAAACQFTRT